MNLAEAVTDLANWEAQKLALEVLLKAYVEAYPRTKASLVPASDLAAWANHRVMRKRADLAMMRAEANRSTQEPLFESAPHPD